METHPETGTTKDEKPSTAADLKKDVKSEIPANKGGHINPSAPEDSNVTPGTVGTK